MLQAQRSFGVPDDGDRSRQDVGGGEAASVVRRREQPAFPPQISALLHRRTVMAAVHLVQHSGADQQQVSPRDHLPGGVHDHVLRLDRDTAHHVENPEQALEDRLGTTVHQRDGAAQQRGSATPEPRDRQQLIPRRVSRVQSGVTDQDDVEQLEITSTGQDGLGSRRYSHSVDQLPGRQRVVPADVKTRSTHAS
jgi:hypothetical protein